MTSLNRLRVSWEDHSKVEVTFPSCTVVLALSHLCAMLAVLRDVTRKVSNAAR